MGHSGCNGESSRNDPFQRPHVPYSGAKPRGCASKRSRETEKGTQDKLRRPSGTRVLSACPYPSASSRHVTRSQAGTILARTSAAKNPTAAPRHRSPDGTHHSRTSHLSPTDHSGAATASTTKNWAFAAAQRQHPPTPTPNIIRDCDSNRTEELGANIAFPLSLTENTGNVRHQSQETQEPTMATSGASLKALVNLQADELQKIIKILQGLAAARTGTTQTAQQPPHVPAATTGEEEGILWEQLSTGNVPPQEVPTRPPTTNIPNIGETWDETGITPLPLLTQQSAKTFSEMCNKQGQENAMAEYPAIFDLQDNKISTSAVRMNTLEFLTRQERPALLIIVTQATHHIRVLWGIEKLPFSYANMTGLDGHIVAFSRDIVAGEKPPTIAISDDWWDREDQPVTSQQTAATKVSKLRPEDHSIPEEVTGTERLNIPIACIAPLVLIHPLLTATYMSPWDAYNLFSERTPAWNWDAPLAPIMR